MQKCYFQFLPGNLGHAPACFKVHNIDKSPRFAAQCIGLSPSSSLSIKAAPLAIKL